MIRFLYERIYSNGKTVIQECGKRQNVGHFKTETEDIATYLE